MNLISPRAVLRLPFHVYHVPFSPAPSFSIRMMSDSLDVASAIIAILQLTQEVTQYLLEVKDANAERQRILNEITSGVGFLYILKNKAESSSSQNDPALFNTLRTLNTTNGPLDQFKFALTRIAKKVRPETGAKKVYKAFAWPFEKGEVNDLVKAIERQKSLFGIALQNDHMYSQIRP
jgi:hypothetical protein